MRQCALESSRESGEGIPGVTPFAKPCAPAKIDADRRKKGSRGEKNFLVHRAAPNPDDTP